MAAVAALLAASKRLKSAWRGAQKFLRRAQVRSTQREGRNGRMADDPHDGEATVVELFDEAIAAIRVMLFVCKGGNGRSFG